MNTLKSVSWLLSTTKPYGNRALVIFYPIILTLDDFLCVIFNTMNDDENGDLKNFSEIIISELMS